MPKAKGKAPAARKSSGGRLSLTLIGKFSATVEGRGVALGRKAQALLGYMILTATRQVPRGKFVSLLWSGKDDQHAKGSLRQLLSEMLRELQACGCQQFKADQRSLILEISKVACDAVAVVTDAERGVVHPLLLARERLSDTLLEDVEDVDQAFSDWVAEARTAYHARLIDALTKLLPEEDQTSISPAEETAAKAMHRLDNENERAIRVLIKAHVAAGNIGAAIAIYARLWRHLEDTYDVEPHKLTQDLIARLRQEQPESTPPLPSSAKTSEVGRAASVTSRPSIAILPFQALSHDLEPKFALGIVSSVIQALSTMKELFVISRASTMIDVTPTLDLRAVGRDLAADYLLHGTIQRSGDQIRIASELIAVETLRVVRNDSLNGTVADVFDLQDRLAVEVIRSLAPQVRDLEFNRAMQTRPDDLDAYQLTLIGYDQMFRPDYTTFVTARTNFERAHELSPTWAAPLSYSAIWHMQRVSRGWSVDPHNELMVARALAERALERNSADPLAIAVSGYTLSQCKLDHAKALAQLDQTIELMPNLALAFAYRSAVQVRCQHYHEALADAAINLRLSPKDRHAWFADMISAQAHFALGDLEAAVAAATRVETLNPADQPNLRILVAALVECGRIDEAETFAPALKQDGVIDLQWIPRSPWPKPVLARVETALANLGRFKGAA